MPNHCENDLYIHGSEADVQAVLDFVGMTGEEPKFDFDKIIPYPQSFKERDESAAAFGWLVKDAAAADIARKAHVEKFGDEKDGYNAGGYDWCCKNWGTKWNAYELALRPYGGVCVTFQTAWSPPIPVIVALAKQFSPRSLSTLSTSNAAWLSPAVSRACRKRTGTKSRHGKPARLPASGRQIPITATAAADEREARR